MRFWKSASRCLRGDDYKAVIYQEKGKMGDTGGIIQFIFPDRGDFTRC